MRETEDVKGEEAGRVTVVIVGGKREEGGEVVILDCRTLGTWGRRGLVLPSLSEEGKR